MVGLVRYRLGVGLALAAMLLAACSGSESEHLPVEVGNAAPWEIGVSVGSVVGPFSLPPEPFQTTSPGGWFSAVLPSGDLVESFQAVVRAAEEHGFDAFARPTGACELSWQREEIPFDVDEGTDDGLGFGGEVPLGEPLPDGAEVTGVNCEAVLTRGDERILVTVSAPGSSSAAFPARNAVFLSSVVDEVPDAPFESTAVDVDAQRRHGGPPTERELELVGNGAAASGAEILDVSVPGLQCKAVAGHSELPLRRSVTDAFDKAMHSYPTELRIDPTIVETAIGELSAATAIAVVPADGPVVYAMATETEAGTSQLFCTQQF